MADTIKPAHHGWDHLPGGEDPLPIGVLDWAVAHGDGEEVLTDNTILEATYTSIAIAPGSTAFVSNKTGVSSSNRPIGIRLDGWYQFWINNWFNGDDIGEYAVGLVYTGGGFWENTDNTNSPRGGAANVNNATNVNFFNGISLGPLYVHQPVNVGSFVRVKEGHSPNTVEIGPLTAVFLGYGLGLPADGSTTINDLYTSF